MSNRQQRRHPASSSDLNTATMKSPPSGARSLNFDPIATPNLHTQDMNTMTDMHTQNTSTTSPRTQNEPVNQSAEATNQRAGQMKTHLPPPTPILEKSDDSPTKAKAPTSKPAASVPATKLDKLVQDYTKLYATLGLFLVRFDPYDGVLLIKESEHRATELINVAKHHKGMMRTLERLAESNDYISLMIGHGMMVYAMLAHHGRLKADPLFLASLGYHEAQVLATPPLDGAGMAQAEGTSDGSHATAASAAH